MKERIRVTAVSPALPHMLDWAECAWCLKKFKPNTAPSQVASGRGKYCSRDCSLAGQRDGTMLHPGQAFSRWTVIEQDLTSSETKWHVRCACGTTRSILGVKLRRGTSRSCGCARREATANRQRIHGQKGTPEYEIWMSMRQRCRNPNNAAYSRYGGRGIAVSEEWDSFKTFLSDMGLRPTSEHSIDRIDNDGPYSRENCRWATVAEQTRNTRRNRWITHNGETRVLADWANVAGVPWQTFASRIDNGWSMNRALAPRRRAAP